jgi:dTMP kinase
LARRYNKRNMVRKGKLVVIDGADGSGKATQTRKLLNYLKKHKIRHKQISFPRYNTYHGQLVGKMLTGEFGDYEKISPYFTSLTFALDRLNARDKIIGWLEQGYLVIADRYVSASMAHQSAKLPEKERKKFLNWLYHLEYEVHHLPKEDLLLFLFVPVEIAQKLIGQKGKRSYVRGKDKAEKSRQHQQRSIEMYQRFCRKLKHWQMINCVEKDRLLSVEAIHKKILAVLRKKKIFR